MEFLFLNGYFATKTASDFFVHSNIQTPPNKLPRGRAIEVLEQR